jgi:hypothetical protein
VLVYAGPRATHFTGYCCWFDVGPRATHFTGYCCWLCEASCNTLLIGLCEALGNTPILSVLLVYVAPRATHVTGYCCWFMRGLGQHTLLGRLIVVGHVHQWVQNNIFFKDFWKVKMSVSVSPPKLQANIPSQTKSHDTASPRRFLNLYKPCHIHKLAPSPKLSGGRVYASMEHIVMYTCTHGGWSTCCIRAFYLLSPKKNFKPVWLR